MKSRFFLVFFLSILLLLVLPQARIGGVRARFVHFVSPKGQTVVAKEELSALQLENLQLREENSRLLAWQTEQEHIEKQTQLLLALAGLSNESFFQRRSAHLRELLENQLQTLPAQVVFSEPSGLSHFIWVNVGEKNNQALGQTVVAKNSPVVIGKSVFGIVEQVFSTHSQVRLVTDRDLNLSVRVVRGGEQDRLLLEKVGHLAKMLETRGFNDPAEILTSFTEQMPLNPSYQYLAKGETHGIGHPLWCRKHSLQGEGFSYDFSDEEGESRTRGDLIQKGDLLVTTGMDGLFPPDFHVALVDKVFPKRSGETSVRIEATPTVEPLVPFMEVYVLPPQTPLESF